MDAEAGDTAPHSPARRLLIDQGRLVRWQIASERAGFALKVLTGAAGLAAAATLGVMAWQASQARGVVLEPFAVPAALVADGVSGEVVASQVLDELSQLRAETGAPGRVTSFANDWGREIQVSIPTTGLSLGDLQTALRQWLGRETRISGEVYRTPVGLALRARVPGRPGLRVEGSATDLETLARELARAIYRDTQPVRYARWLTEHNFQPEAVELAQRIAMTSPERDERVEAYAAWAYALNRQRNPAAAAEVVRRALALNPTSSVAWGGLTVYEGNLGHNAVMLEATRQVLRLRPRDPILSPKVRQQLARNRGIEANLLADYSEALKQGEIAARDAGEVAAIGSLQLDRDIANAMARLHDIAGAERRLDASPSYQSWRGTDDFFRSTGKLTRLYVAEDWAGVIGDPNLLPSDVNDNNRSSWSVIMLARAKTGDIAGARTILSDLRPDDDNTMIDAGRALAAMGDLAGGDRALAIVEARAPFSPIPTFFRGRIRLDAGDVAGALPHFRAAQKSQPKWADPFRYEGDALARLGKWKEAEAAYARAYPLAPKWGGLHLIWGQALARLGRADEARAKWRTAAGLYLTALERAELTTASRNRTP